MTQPEIIEKQRRVLLVYAERHGITKACKVFGVSRTTFYKLKQRFLETGSLAPRIRRKPRMPNETVLSKKKMLLSLVRDHPAWGPVRYEAAFRAKGISLDAVTIWQHLKHYGLNRRYQRLVYLEALQKTSQPLTDRTLARIRRHLPKIQHGLWPGHVSALDTFYVGHLKGVGRIYQMTGIDLCSRFGWARLYTDKGQDASVDFLENQWLPRMFHNGVGVESVLTDNGSEFIGRRFRELLQGYDIHHIRIPKGRPICNGYCERFQRTIGEEFYQKVFRTQFFTELNALQEKLNEYLIDYNFKRLHFGLDPKGAIPMDALKSRDAFLRRRFKELST